MRHLRFLLLTAAAASYGHAQTQLHLQTQAKAVDFSNSTSTRPVKTGTVLPAVCSPGELFFKRDAPSGQNLYGCAATNVWMPQSGGGSGSGVVITMTTGAGAPSGNCAAPGPSNLTLYADTTNQDIWACPAANVWKKILSTTDAGPYVATGANGATPAMPAAGSLSTWFDSTYKTMKAIDDTGAITSMVRQSVAAGSVYVAGYEVGSESAPAAFATADLTSHAFAINDGNAKTLTEASCISDSGSQTVTVKIGAGTLFSITCVPAASYSRSATNGSTGYIAAASMGSTAIGAGAMLDLSGTANTTTKDIKLHIYGTVN